MSACSGTSWQRRTRPAGEPAFIQCGVGDAEFLELG